MPNQSQDSSPWKNKYWYSYNDFLSQRFGEKVYKITVSAGFTCPTRDGTKGTEGCAFCDERGSSSFYSAGNASGAIKEQIEKTIPSIKRRFHANKYIAYFQSFTNTYGPIDYLREVYDGALNIPDVVGLAIGTRPDCIPNEVLSLINGYGRNRFVCLELGVQSFKDNVLDFYQRGHSAEEAIDAIQRTLKFPNIHLSVHLMFGAPTDTVEDAIKAAHLLNKLGVHGVKIHHLMVLKNTVLATKYKLQPWELLSLEAYNEIAKAFIENLNPEIYIERTHAASSHPDELVGPHWSSMRFEPLNKLKKLMQMQGSVQGKLLTPII